MNAIVPREERSADLVHIAGLASPAVIAPAAARARLFLRHHAIERPEAAVGVRLVGDVVIVAVEAIDPAAMLMLAEIRKRVASQLIVIAADVPAEQRILALTLGADHVLDAQVDERELTAVLRNSTRATPSRLGMARTGEAPWRWRLEADRWVLVAPNLREVRLTRSEYTVLGLLIGNAGAIRSRAELLAGINGCAERERVLDVLISKLRRKVWDCAQMELPLRSARNAGYVFAGRVGRMADPSVPATAATQH
ncbi:winged helix-turn-helix domain-containing protein [Sphingomonas sp. PR090111-T3T-6A]|uniref:winged helix-turn-helix domain-containing protein n=1 Tax=Sphingomonas sp. PR090111-T3T-6A TaxID=685778 RepID=UPI000362D3C0|nr:winged helix-turn-helix domain-containing protein [Sphingomonas sp. PR090111-T3T-6A]